MNIKENFQLYNNIVDILEKNDIKRYTEMVEYYLDQGRKGDISISDMVTRIRACVIYFRNNSDKDEDFKDHLTQSIQDYKDKVEQMVS